MAPLRCVFIKEAVINNGKLFISKSFVNYQYVKLAIISDVVNSVC